MANKSIKLAALEVVRQTFETSLNNQWITSRGIYLALRELPEFGISLRFTRVQAVLSELVKTGNLECQGNGLYKLFRFLKELPPPAPKPAPAPKPPKPPRIRREIPPPVPQVQPRVVSDAVNQIANILRTIPAPLRKEVAHTARMLAERE